MPRKLFLKGVIESFSAHSCAPQLLQNTVHKAAPQSCSRNLLSKAGPRSYPRAALHNPRAVTKNPRNPVEPDLALHQGFLDPSPPESCWTWPGSAPASQAFSRTFGTFSGTSLNLTRRLHQCTPELFWAEDPIRPTWGIEHVKRYAGSVVCKHRGCSEYVL